MEDARAQAVDLDCVVILCLPVGFAVSGCGQAKSYMLDRITSWPPLPPFGFCSFQGAGGGFTPDQTNFRFLSGPESYFCDDSRQLFIISTDEDDEGGGGSDFRATCATGSFFEDQGETSETVYINEARPTVFTYEIQIVVEEGTENEYRSPLFRGNFNGEFRQFDS